MERAGGLWEAEHFWSACEAQLAPRAWQGLGTGCHIPGKSPDSQAPPCPLCLQVLPGTGWWGDRGPREGGCTALLGGLLGGSPSCCRGKAQGLFAKSVFAECPLCHAGAKHKSMLEGHSTQIRRGRGKLLSRAGHKSKRIGNKGSINIQNKAFHCQVCEIYVNSETQLKQHMSSRRHKDRLAGKPPKPKYSPYNKLQKNAALAVSILKVSVSLQITHPVCSPKCCLPC
ncbi:PREDICTED: zinc finger protein 385C-like [Haliaeetus leucocephalus]|uniref:zinc finger protein 385C-like n=1 Tax=Haliaeetus leucocephalus TaxID=52644 RepID=UPI00053CDC2A|nr:PREDICTED: zinc finger protein 385C-like [Haliaeetus leucocephalus]